MKALGAVLLSVLLTLAASAADISGAWSGSLIMTGPDGQTHNDTVHMVLKQEGGKITGTAGPNASEQMPIEKGTVDGNKVALEVPIPNGTSFKFDIALDGEHLKGEVTMSGGGQAMKAQMDATRAK